MNKTYVVALLSFFDNDIKQSLINAKSPYDAVKHAMLNFFDSEEAKKDELEWQSSEDYPKTYGKLVEYLSNSEFAVSVIEII